MFPGNCGTVTTCIMCNGYYIYIININVKLHIPYKMHPPSKNCPGLGISKICSKEIGYEHADLTVHHPSPPPPQELLKVCSFFFRVGG